MNLRLFATAAALLPMCVPLDAIAAPAGKLSSARKAPPPAPKPADDPGAQEKESDSPIDGIDFQGGTEFPLFFGGSTRLRLKGGLQPYFGIGFVPNAYVKMINGLAKNLGAYNQETADLIEDSLSNSLYLDFRMGFDPGQSGGFHFDLGYSVMTVGASVSSVKTLELATGKSFDELKSEAVEQAKAKTGGRADALIDRAAASGAVQQADPEIDVSTTMHSVTLHLGYIATFGDAVTLTTDIGLIKALAGNTKIGGKTAAREAALESANSKIDGYLDEIYRKYVIIPTVSLLLGIRI